MRCIYYLVTLNIFLKMSAGKVIVYGGKGALGSVIIEHFKANNFWTLSIDLVANDAANACVQVDGSASWAAQEQTILNGVAAVLESPVDGIFCVAGGWAGGNAASDDFVKSADLMWKQSIWSSTIAAKIATKYLKPGGLLQLTGAAAASEGTPGMIGYGMAKAAVHQLTLSLAAEGSGIPEQCTILTILPITLDTPMNRKWMPKADFGTWTPMNWVAKQLQQWISDYSSRPKSGSLLKLKTANSQTEISCL